MKVSTRRRIRASGKDVAVFAFIVLVFLGAHDASAKSGTDEPDCEINRSACAKPMGEETIVLDIDPRPVKAMNELTFTVTIASDRQFPDEGQRATVELDMPGMYMGTNRIVLKRLDSHRYRGTGVIPKCPGGGRLWRATVDFAEKGSARFLFNVEY